MKTENEILTKAAKEANVSCIVEDNGCYFPVVDGRLANPLDPESYINVFRRNENYRKSCKVPLLEKVLDTCWHASRFRDAGFEVVTYSTPGVPKVIKSEGLVYILGDYSKKNNLIYPLLCIQLSDNTYDQSKSDAWASFKFRTPSKINVLVDAEWEPDRGFLGADDSARCTYTLNSDAYESQRLVTIYSDDHFTAHGLEVTYEACFDTKPKPKKRKVVAKKTTPDYIWQDKGEA